jgi:hypothetical protein
MRASASAVRAAGLLLGLAYAGVLVWVYVEQPASLAEMQGGLVSTVGLYTIDTVRFAEGRRLLHADRFPEARAELERADPAHRDGVTQFYIAYSYYRQGWGRFYNDDALFKQALAALDRAAALSATGRVEVNDPALGLRDSDALRAELQRGLTLEAEDLNPMRALRRRQ